MAASDAVPPHVRRRRALGAGASAVARSVPLLGQRAAHRPGRGLVVRGRPA